MGTEGSVMRRNFSGGKTDAFRGFLRSAQRVYMPRGPAKCSMKRNPSMFKKDIEPWQIQHLCEVFGVEEEDLLEVRFQGKFPLDPTLGEKEIERILRQSAMKSVVMTVSGEVFGSSPRLAARNPSLGYPVFKYDQEYGIEHVRMWRDIVSNSAFDLATMMYGDSLVGYCCEAACFELYSSSFEFREAVGYNDEYVENYIRSLAKVIRSIEYDGNDELESVVIQAMGGEAEWVTSSDAARWLSELGGYELPLDLGSVQGRGEFSRKKIGDGGRHFRPSYIDAGDLLYHARLIKKVGPVVESMIRRGLILSVVRWDIMSYRSLRGLGALQSTDFWMPDGFETLQFDKNGVQRPEYPAIVASASVPGFGWTQYQLDAGQLPFNGQVPFGPYNFLTLKGQWSNAGFMTLYVAKYLGAPDAFLTRVLTSELWKWKGQPGVWVAKMPYGNGFSKQGWAPYLPIDPSVQPQPPAPKPTPVPAFSCPAGQVEVSPGVCAPLGTPKIGGQTQPVIPVPPEQGWWGRMSAEDREQLVLAGCLFLAGAAILAFAGGKWAYDSAADDDDGAGHPASSPDWRPRDAGEWNAMPVPVSARPTLLSPNKGGRVDGVPMFWVRQGNKWNRRWTAV